MLAEAVGPDQRAARKMRPGHRTIKRVTKKFLEVSRLLTQLPLVIVCHELIIWRLTIYGSAMV